MHTCKEPAREGWVSEACRSMQSDQDGQINQSGGQVRGGLKVGPTRLLQQDHNLLNQGSQLLTGNAWPQPQTAHLQSAF